MLGVVSMRNQCRVAASGSSLARLSPSGSRRVLGLLIGFSIHMVWTRRRDRIATSENKYSWRQTEANERQGIGIPTFSSDEVRLGAHQQCDLVHIMPSLDSTGPAGVTYVAETRHAVGDTALHLRPAQEATP